MGTGGKFGVRRLAAAFGTAANPERYSGTREHLQRSSKLPHSK